MKPAAARDTPEGVPGEALGERLGGTLAEQSGESLRRFGTTSCHSRQAQRENVKYRRGNEPMIDPRSTSELSLAENLPSLAVSVVERMLPDSGVILEAAILYIQHSAAA